MYDKRFDLKKGVLLCFSGRAFSLEFSIEKPTENKRQEKSYRNPVILAMEMKELMERENISRAELSRRMKLSRARITQIINVLKLSPEAIEMIKEMGGMKNTATTASAATRARSG